MVNTDNNRLVHCSGEIDLGTVDEFQAKLEHALRYADHGQPVTIDLRDVSFFGSAGVQALAEAGKTSRDHRTRLRVLPSEPVYRTLELVGMLDDYHFGWTPSETAHAA